MAAQTLREQLIATLDTLDDDQIAALLHYVEMLRLSRLPEDYDEANDPILNGELAFRGPSDLGSRTKDILKAEFGLRKSTDDKTAE